MMVGCVALCANIASTSYAAEAGKDIYKTYCWQCHGSHGDGKGINAGDNMSVAPRNHTDAEYMGGRSDADLFKAIKDGGPAVNKSVLMPPWSGVINDDEIHALVDYLRELCGCKYGSAS
jgi:cytochrome c oxidase cbb3-type subunit III